MASLQCPSCGNRHPVDIVPDTETFACQQCRRLLKVPDALRHRRVDAIVTPHSGPNGDGGPGARVSTLDAPVDTVDLPPARAAAAPPPAAPGAAVSSPASARGERPPGTRSALAAAVEARSATPVRTPPPHPAEIPQEILAPPLTPQASAALAPAARDRDHGVEVGPTAPPGRPPGPSAAPIVVATTGGDRFAGDDRFDGDEDALAPGPVRVHWTLRLLIWLAALAIAAVAVVVPYRRVGLIDFDGALKVIGGRGFDQWELPLIIVPPWAMGTALIAHFSIEGLARLRRRSVARRRTADPVVTGPA